MITLYFQGENHQKLIFWNFIIFSLRDKKIFDQNSHVESIGDLGSIFLQPSVKSYAEGYVQIENWMIQAWDIKRTRP